MSKPTYILRYPATGDTIPPSKSPGPGDPANRVYYDTNRPGGYDATTRCLGWQDQTTSQVMNRANWYLANCVDWLYEREFVLPVVASITAGTSGDKEYRIQYPVFLGYKGFTASDIVKVISITSSSVLPLYKGTTQIKAADITTASAGGGVSLYPAGGLPAINSNPVIIDDLPAANQITVASDFADPSYSLINYSMWLRGLRDNDTSKMYNSFATVTAETGTGPYTYTMHKDVKALGWTAGDELFISYFASDVYVQFNTATPAGANYKVIFGTNVPAGRVGLDRYETSNLVQPEAQRIETSKIIDLSLGQPINLWTFNMSAGVYWTASTSAGGSEARIIFPILLPANSIITQIELRYGHSDVVSTDGTLTLYKQQYSGATTIASTDFDTGGGTSTITLPVADEVVDNPNYSYFVRIDSGVDSGGNITHYIYGLKVTFKYDDIVWHP